MEFDMATQQRAQKVHAEKAAVRAKLSHTNLPSS
jgi:hypothetical protein